MARGAAAGPAPGGAFFARRPLPLGRSTTPPPPAPGVSRVASPAGGTRVPPGGPPPGVPRGTPPPPRGSGRAGRVAKKRKFRGPPQAATAADHDACILELHLLRGLDDALDDVGALGFRGHRRVELLDLGRTARL